LVHARRPPLHGNALNEAPQLNFFCQRREAGCAVVIAVVWKGRSCWASSADDFKAWGAFVLVIVFLLLLSKVLGVDPRDRRVGGNKIIACDECECGVAIGLAVVN
jgi:hypothetical protein